MSAPGGCLLLRGCLLWGVSALGGVSAPGGVCSRGCVSAPGGCLLQGGVRQTPPGSRAQHTVNERPVRILLECVLVVPWLQCLFYWVTGL